MKGESIRDKQLSFNSERISYREIEGEILVLDKKRKIFYELNKTASIIWKEIIHKRSIDKIIKILQEKYDKMDREKIEKDVIDFISLLIRKKYLLVKNGN